MDGQPPLSPDQSASRGHEARAFLAMQAHEEAEAARTLLEETRAALPAIAARLVALGATEVHVFGSVIRGDFDVRSDLDLATRGLSPELWIDAKVAAAALSPVPCDLVELETAPPALRDNIIHEGRRIDGGP
jgi:predicted nucleotidyltransferase